MCHHSKLDNLIYNAPLAYADLVVKGDTENIYRKLAIKTVFIGLLQLPPQKRTVLFVMIWNSALLSWIILRGLLHLSCFYSMCTS